MPLAIRPKIMARYEEGCLINHTSSIAHANLKPIYHDFKDGIGPRVQFKVTQPIFPGDELLYKYGDSAKYLPSYFYKCLCSICVTSNKVAAAGDVGVEERDVKRPPPPSTTTEATEAAVEVEVAAETQPPSPPQIESGESSRTHHLTPTVMIRPPPGSSSPSSLSDDDIPPPRPPTASYGLWANTKRSGKGEGKNLWSWIRQPHD